MLAYTFSRHVSPTNLRFSFGSCRFRCIIFVLLLNCLAVFALTLIVCLFACRRKRNDRTRRGPMQRGATLPLPFRWPSTKGCNNTITLGVVLCYKTDASSIVTAYSRVVWTSLREFTSAVSMLSFARWIASISTRVISTVSSGSSAGLGCDSAFCQRCLDCAAQSNL